MRRLWVDEKLRRDTSGTADLVRPKTYDIMLSNKSWGKKDEGSMFRAMAFVSPTNHDA